MARHYSTREIFRQMPNVLLARFSKGHGVFDALDFSALSETKPDVFLACG